MGRRRCVGAPPLPERSELALAACEGVPRELFEVHVIQRVGRPVRRVREVDGAKDEGPVVGRIRPCAQPPLSAALGPALSLAALAVGGVVAVLGACRSPR